MPKYIDQEKKPILIVTPWLDEKGGVANYYNTILPFLKASEFTIYSLEIGSVKNKTNWLYPFIDQIKFQKIIKHLRPVLVVVNPSFDPKSLIRDGMFVFQTSQLNIPIIAFFHGWRNKFAHTIEKYLLRCFQATWGRTNAFIVLASKFKNRLISWNVSPSIYVETTTVEPKLLENFNIEKRVLSLQQTDTLRVLFLARIEPAKGVFETVDAISMLLKKGFPVTLSIAGDGSAKTQLDNYIDSLDFPDDTIKCIGYVDGSEKSSTFENHDLYCLPTYYDEGLPISLLEALAFGMPVVTCSVGGITNFFHDGKMGVLVPIRDAEAIANSIEKMSSETGAMVRMAQYNHSFAIETLSASKVASRITDICRKTISLS